MYIKFKKGNAYVFRSVRTGGRVQQDYVGPYWRFYADRGVSWEQFATDSFRAMIFLNRDRLEYLSLVETRVRAAKVGNGIVLLPNGTRKSLYPTVGYKSEG